MPADNELGDLIVTLSLDDAQYKEEIRETLYLTTENINKIKALLESEKTAHLAVAVAAGAHTAAVAKLGAGTQSATGQIKVINALAQEAHQRFGVMANTITGVSTAFRLLGLESAYGIVEAGRLSLYFGRAITSGGGMTGMLMTLVGALRAFAIAIGPVGWLLTAAGAAWLYFSRAPEKATEAIKKQKADLEELHYAMAKSGWVQWQVEGGYSTSVKMLELKEKFPKATQRDLDYLLLGDEALLVLKAKDRAEQLRLQTSILEGQGTAYDLIVDRSERVAKMEHDRVELLNRAGISFGGKHPSDFMDPNDPRFRIQRWMDNAALEREAASPHSGGGTSSLGPAGSEFRFGPGAMGSMIGAENEQKKTNELLQKVIENQKTAYVELQKQTTALGGNDPGSAIGSGTGDSSWGGYGWEH